MVHVLTTKEYKAIEDKNVLSMTLVKTKPYSLKPFGRFSIKWQCTPATAKKPHILPYVNIRFDTERGMPCTPEQEKAIVKFMVKHRTDVLTDGKTEYYTRMDDNIVQIHHAKIQGYWLFLQREQAEDNKETWDRYVELN